MSNKTALPVGKRVSQTSGVRIPMDLAEMLSEIISHDRELTIPAILDPLIRSTVEAEFAKLPKAFRDRAVARIQSRLVRE